MKKRRWHFIGVALIALTLIGAMAAYGHRGHGHGGHKFGHGHGGFPFRILRSLDLSEEQRAQIKTINEAHREAFAALWKEKRSVLNEVTDKMLAAGTVTPDTFASQADRLAALEARMFKEHMAVAVQVRNLLTPEQLSQAAKLVAEKRARWQERKNAPEAEQ
jgi:P pilus assembly/Cpx signaling pathway, periplasmic inhibitor/zinc-resistance associated protein